MSDLYLTAESRRWRFVQALRSAIGRPYCWGGQSPEDGFDCSGLIVWALNHAGVELADMNAQGLADHFHACRMLHPRKPGELVFYGNGGLQTIHHVMAVLTTWGEGRVVLIGSRGGIDTTTNPAEAYRRRAYVCTRTGHYWSSKQILTVDPFLVKL